MRIRAFVVVTMLAALAIAGVPAAASVTITGEFATLSSFGCYPARFDISAHSVDTTLELFGGGVLIYDASDVTCAGAGYPAIFYTLTAGPASTFKVNFGRDLINDTRVAASISGLVFASGEPATVQPVSFVELIPSIDVTPPFLYPATREQRNTCYDFIVSAFPETLPVQLSVTSSTTNGVPDLELFADRDCQTPLGALDLPAGRLAQDQALLGVMHNPDNGGNAGTIMAVADPSFVVNGQSYPQKSVTLFFDPRTSLKLTASTLSGLNPFSCSRATVSIGAADVNAIIVRLTSETRNLAIYDSPECATPVGQIKLTPNQSRNIYFRPFPNVSYATLIADTRNAGNVEVTAPAMTSLTFFFKKCFSTGYCVALP